jgi:putative flippase GtrA
MEARLQTAEECSEAAAISGPLPGVFQAIRYCRGVTTLQDPPATSGAPGTAVVRSESAFRHLARELVSFGVVGTIGTALTFIFSNLGEHFVSTNPMVTVVIPMTLSTVVSYLLSRAYTFRHRDSDGSSKEVLLFFAVNVIGMIIQLLCWNVRTNVLHLNGAISQNVTLAIGTALGAAFRYWSYKKWIFLPAAA